VAARGKVHKLWFFIHNFMDACALDENRVNACTFVAVTSDGPISMCLHNAERDAFILKPLKITGAAGEALWNPLSGKVEPSNGVPTAVNHSPKTAKGRLKALGANRPLGPC
jgi:7,8-dihydro-6-hydroxymethylpterin dimethyltransferase